MDSPFQTNNKKLAYALCLAGVRFSRAAAENPNQDGPAFNDYTPEFLRQPRFASRIKGKTLNEAAAALIAAKIPGNVVYCFERGPELERALRVDNECSEAFEKAKNEGGEPQIPEVSLEDTMRVLFVAQHNSTTEAFAKIPFIRRRDQRVNTMVSGSEKRESVPGGTKTTVTARGGFHTVGASEEILRKFKH